MSVDLSRAAMDRKRQLDFWAEVAKQPLPKRLESYLARHDLMAAGAEVAPPPIATMMRDILEGLLQIGQQLADIPDAAVLRELVDRER